MKKTQYFISSTHRPYHSCPRFSSFSVLQTLTPLSPSMPCPAARRAEKAPVGAVTLSKEEREKTPILSSKPLSTSLILGRWALSVSNPPPRVVALPPLECSASSAHWRDQSLIALLNPSRLTQSEGPLFCLIARKPPFRSREEFRTPAGVRKSPKNEPAGCRAGAMEI